MKRTAILLLILVLLFCTVLSSCSAEHILRPALLQMAGNGLRDWSEKANTLLTGREPEVDETLDDLPLAEGGKALYALTVDPSLSPALTAKIEALCDTVHALCGVDLREAPAEAECRGKLMITLNDPTIGNTIHIKDTQFFHLTASTYFVGFSNNNFYIYAKNELMLSEALDRFLAALVTGEGANIGEGFLKADPLTALSGDRFFAINQGQANYVLLRADEASDAVKKATMALQKAIKEATGIDLSIETDFRTAKHNREIVVGETKRPESTAAKEGLGVADYCFATYGERLVIAAGSDSALEAAVDAFIEMFITAEGADLEAEKHLYLPASLSHTQRADATWLIENGECPYTVVYAANATTTVKNYINTFIVQFKSLTGIQLTAVSDADCPIAEGRREILVGATNRPESTTATESAADSLYTVTLIDGQIAITHKNNRQAQNALTALQNYLKGYYSDQNGDKQGGDLFVIDISLP